MRGISFREADLSWSLLLPSLRIFPEWSWTLFLSTYFWAMLHLVLVLENQAVACPGWPKITSSLVLVTAAKVDSGCGVSMCVPCFLHHGSSHSLFPAAGTGNCFPALYPFLLAAFSRQSNHGWCAQPLAHGQAVPKSFHSSSSASPCQAVHWEGREDGKETKPDTGP